MKKKILFLKLILVPVFVLGGCMNEEFPPDMLNADAESISVVTAVQLGAEPGCMGVNYRISGNVTMMRLDEDAEMALVLEDGDPLCVDTYDVIKDELERLEGNLMELIPDENRGDEFGDLMREGRNADGLKQDSGGGGSNSGNGGGPKIDPNPQPANQTSVNTPIASDIAFKYSPDPSSPSGGKNSPAGDAPTVPHNE
jgi:hypothetical protein